MLGNLLPPIAHLLGVVILGSTATLLVLVLVWFTFRHNSTTSVQLNKARSYLCFRLNFNAAILRRMKAWSFLLRGPQIIQAAYEQAHTSLYALLLLCHVF